MENRNKSNNGPIRFPFSVKPILEEVPDFDEMGIEELKACIEQNLSQEE